MFDREQLGRIAFDAMNEYARSLEGDNDDTWETETERNREGIRWMAEAVARAVQTASAPIRYRRVSLNGHLSLGVCRVVEVSVGGATMLSATTLCDEKERTVEFPASSVYRLDALTETEALDAAREATERRAAQARAEEERTRREAREQALRREARATAAATVTVFGPHVEMIVTDPDKVPRADLLRRDDAEVIEALRAAEIEPYSARDLYTDTRDAALVGLEIVHEAERVDAIVAMLHALGFGTVTRLPDQPARVEVPDEEIPFDPTPVGGDMT